MRASNIALFTLTALAIGDLAQQAIAAPLPPTSDSALPESTPEAAEEEVSTAEVAAIAPESLPITEAFTPSEVPASPDLSLSAAPESSSVAEPPAIDAPSFIAVPELASQPELVQPESIQPESIIQPEFAPQPPPPASLPQPAIPSLAEPLQAAPPTPELLAQAAPNTTTPEIPPTDPTDQEVEDLQRQLDGVPNLQPEFGDEFGGAPAITLSNPSGRGADNFVGFINTSFQADKRYENGADGSIGIGIGLGDSRRAVGLQLSYTLASFGTLDRDFGTGGFNAKLHRQFDNGLSVALGWEGFATIGDVDFEDTIYGTITQIIRTTPDIDRPFSRIALTAGVGNGRFRSEEDVNNDVDGVNVFGSAAVRIARPVSVIVEWTGQDLAAGVSIAPFRNFPLVITPALRDITGAGDGARFVIGTGVSFQF